MVSEGPKALSPKLAQALFASMFVVLWWSGMLMGRLKKAW
jgi:hypothetical protein